MLLKSSVITGTIMITNAKDETYFLASLKDNKYYIPSTEKVNEDKSALATILDVLLDAVTFQSDELRLLDSTKISGTDFESPLFVFDSTLKIDKIDTLIRNKKEYAWEKTSDLMETLSGFEFGGVPIYQN